jgi:adhesin/invasin
VFVRFVVTDGGGLLNVTKFPLDSTMDYLSHTTTTDAEGIARLSSWRLGSPGIAQRVTAFVSVASNHAVDFDANAITGPFWTLTTTDWPVEDRMGVVGQPLRNPPTLLAVDAGFNPVAGVAVTWNLPAGNGTITEAETITGPDGTARIGSWVLGTRAGHQSLFAQANLPNQIPLSLGVPAAPGPVASIEKLVPDLQVAPAGGVTPAAPRVRLRDQYGNPAFPRQVIFSVLSGGGSVDNTHRIADSDGTAGVMEWRLGNVPGENRLSVTADGVSTQFLATGVP